MAIYPLSGHVNCGLRAARNCVCWRGLVRRAAVRLRSLSAIAAGVKACREQSPSVEAAVQQLPVRFVRRPSNRPRQICKLARRRRRRQRHAERYHFVCRLLHQHVQPIVRVVILAQQTSLRLLLPRPSPLACDTRHSHARRQPQHLEQAETHGRCEACPTECSKTRDHVGQRWAVAPRPSEYNAEQCTQFDCNWRKVNLDSLSTWSIQPSTGD